jgi:hypothetical protein
MLSGKQEVALARRVDNYFGWIAPLDFRDVSPSKDTDPKQQVDLNNVANEVPFLITETELRDRKMKRRQKHNAPRP